MSAESPRPAAGVRLVRGARDAAPSRRDRIVDALPDLLFAAGLAIAALGFIDVSDEARGALTDVALWDFPIQAGASIAAAAALSVRALRRPWLTVLCAVAGFSWTVGPFYAHEFAQSADDRNLHLVTATIGIVVARFVATWPKQVGGLGLTPREGIAIFQPVVHSMLFYGALLVAAIAFLAGWHPSWGDGNARPLAALAVAYGVRGVTLLPPVARRIHRRLARTPAS